MHAQVDVCAKALAACAGHCEAHADVAKHCGVCADACRRAERATQQLLVGFATLVSSRAVPPRSLS